MACREVSPAGPKARLWDRPPLRLVIRIFQTLMRLLYSALKVAEDFFLSFAKAERHRLLISTSGVLALAAHAPSRTDPHSSAHRAQALAPASLWTRAFFLWHSVWIRDRHVGCYTSIMATNRPRKRASKGVPAVSRLLWLCLQAAPKSLARANGSHSTLNFGKVASRHVGPTAPPWQPGRNHACLERKPEWQTILSRPARLTTRGSTTHHHRNQDA